MNDGQRKHLKKSTNTKIGKENTTDANIRIF